MRGPRRCPVNIDRGPARSHAGINVTPLVDILLVLLIIFMVITPVLQTGFQTQLPKSDAKGPSAAVVLQIFRGGRLCLNRQPLQERDLPAQLAAVYTTRGDKTLFIDAEDRVPYDTLVRVLDTCRAPGMAETIGFVLN
jgi:biopolymer transport protein ExbD